MRGRRAVTASCSRTIASLEHFGGGNSVSIEISVDSGTVFTLQNLHTIKDVTDAIYAIIIGWVNSYGLALCSRGFRRLHPDYALILWYGFRRLSGVLRCAATATKKDRSGNGQQESAEPEYNVVARRV